MLFRGYQRQRALRQVLFSRYVPAGKGRDPVGTQGCFVRYLDFMGVKFVVLKFLPAGV